jgi:hypothetical protein
MQKLELSDNRDAASKSLLEWVRSQPEIKREWLAKDILNYPGLISESAKTALQELAERTSNPRQK